MARQAKIYYQNQLAGYLTEGMANSLINMLKNISILLIQNQLV